MKTMRLIRLSDTIYGTFGVLIDNGIPFCVTLELPWRNNIRNKSCIPADVYMCRRIESPRFGETFEITAVPKRSNILFHKGNLEEDTKGCILVGEKFDKLYNKPAVLASGDAFKEFMEKLEGEEEFILSIKNLDT